MPKCVVLSERAFISLLVETQEKILTETGGVFLGYRSGDIWYVIESIDPGPESIFQSAYFEYDQGYVNHLINKVSRIYKTQLDLIGLWHRHPGSFDRFSGTDDITNTSYAEMDGDGAISALVNIDPNFRLTMYEVKLPLTYTRIPVVIGDSLIPKHLLSLKDPTYLQRLMDNKLGKKGLKRFSLLQPKTEKLIKDNDEEKRIKVLTYSFSASLKDLLESGIILSDIDCNNHIPIEEGIEDLLIALEPDMTFLGRMDIQCEMNIKDERYLAVDLDIEGEKLQILFFVNDAGCILLESGGKVINYCSNMFEEAYKKALMLEDTR